MKPGHSQIEVPRAVKDALRDYILALESGYNRQVGDGDLLAAFLAGVPHWQAELMLQGYRSQETSRRSPGPEDG
jgi:hypothetical protein